MWADLRFSLIAVARRTSRADEVAYRQLSFAARGEGSEVHMVT